MHTDKLTMFDKLEWKLYTSRNSNATTLFPQRRRLAAQYYYLTLNSIVVYHVPLLILAAEISTCV